MLSVLRKFNLIMYCLFVLQPAIFQCGFVNAQVQAQVSGQMPNFEQGMPDLSNLGGMLKQFLDPSVFQGITEEEMRAQDEEYEKKMEMLEALPLEFRREYDSSEARYLDFLRKISIKNGLQDICKNFKNKLNELSAKKQAFEVTEAVNTAIGLLDKFESALFAGAFPQIPAAMPEFKMEDLFSNMTKKLQEKQFPIGAADSDEQSSDKEALDVLSNLYNQDSQDKKYGNAPSVKFEADDFDQLFGALAKLLPAVKESQDKELVSDLVTFRNIVVTLKNDNRLETMRRYFNYLSPFQKKAYSAVSNLRKIFVEKLREIRNEVQSLIVDGQESSLETKKLKQQGRVYVYWKKELNLSLSYLNKFDELKKSSDTIFSNKDWFFDKAGFLYDLSLSFLNCYKRDIATGKRYTNDRTFSGDYGRLVENITDPRWLAVKSYEWSVSGLFAYWTYKSMSFKMANPQLMSHVMDGKSFGQNQSSNPMEMLMPLLNGGMSGSSGDPMVMLSMMSGMMGPGMEKMQKRILFFMALAAAFSPKGLGQYGEIVSTLKDVFAAVIYDNVKAYKLGFKDWKAWPNGMQALKGEVFYLGQHLTAKGSDLACSMINKCFPLFWPTSRRWSAGIVSPDLIRSFMLKLFPIMLYSKNFLHKPCGSEISVADFSEENTLMQIANHADPNDLAGVDEKVSSLPYYRQVPMRVNTLSGTNPEYNLFDAGVDEIGHQLGEKQSTLDRYKRFKREGNHKLVNFEVYCLESFLVSYMFSCIGSKFGQFVAKRYNKPICGTAYKVIDYTFDKVLNLCHKCYLIDSEERESWNETKEEVESMFDSVPEMIDALMEELSDSTSELRMIAISLLTSCQAIKIDEGDQEKPGFQEKINTQIVFYILTLLVNKIGIISLGDAYELMGTYLTSGKHNMILVTYWNNLKLDIKKNGKAAINPDAIIMDLKAMDDVLAKDFTNILEKRRQQKLDDSICAVRALKEIKYQAKTKFSKALAEKLKVNLFAGAMGQLVIGPIFNETVGNWIKDKGTILDGIDWVKEKGQMVMASTVAFKNQVF